jgi:hypothetical protein
MYKSVSIRCFATTAFGRNFFQRFKNFFSKDDQVQSGINGFGFGLRAENRTYAPDFFSSR